LRGCVTVGEWIAKQVGWKVCDVVLSTVMKFECRDWGKVIYVNQNNKYSSWW